MRKMVKCVFIVLLAFPVLSALADEYYVGSMSENSNSPAPNLIKSFQVSNIHSSQMSAVLLNTKELPEVDVPLLSNPPVKNKKGGPTSPASLKPLKSEQETIQEDFKNLIQQNTELKNRVNELNQEIKRLRESPPKGPAPQLKTSLPIKPIHKESSFFKNANFILSMGTVLISVALLLLFILILPRKSTPAAPRHKEIYKERPYEKRPIKNDTSPLSKYDDPEEEKEDNEVEEEHSDLATEYDFMNSEDAIPIRLDLARTYLEMAQFAEAKEALQPVLEKGSEAEKQEAMELLKEINAAHK